MSTRSYPEAEYIKNNLSIEEYFNEVIVKSDEGKKLYGNKVSFYDTPTVLCPLHSENTGSFRFYENTKSFYCFGCGRGGDVIKLHQYYYEINFGITKRYTESVSDLFKIIERIKSSNVSIKDIKELEHSNYELNNHNIVTRNKEIESTDKLKYILEENRVFRFLYSNRSRISDVCSIVSQIDDIRNLFYCGEIDVGSAITDIRKHIKI